jgi:hypothetical protein
MSEPENILKNAAIKWDGRVRGGPNDQPIDMYVVETREGLLWFEVENEYAKNENDFQVIVCNFGLRDKSAAGSTWALLRRNFTPAEVQTARARLEALFLGPHDDPSLPFVPFRIGQGKCLGVNFPRGWINVT